MKLNRDDIMKFFRNEFQDIDIEEGFSLEDRMEIILELMFNDNIEQIIRNAFELYQA